MKRLIIVSTRPSVGKGGISTALDGYISGLKAKGVAFELVESHFQQRNTLICWVSALYQVAKYAAKYRKNAIFWFHIGPWLSMFRKFTLALIAKLFGAKTIGHIHSPAITGYLQGSVLKKIFTQICLSVYGQLVVLTPWWQKYLLSQGIKKPMLVCANPNSDHSSQIANGYVKKPRQYSNLDTQVNMFSMARLAEGKNIDLVIKALNYLPQYYTLTIAGDGPLEVRYKQLVVEQGLSDRVTFAGWVSDSGKERLLKEADLFCLPSSYDSFGMVFIEAMAFDLPVIAYGWGPINDVVTADVGECCQHLDEQEIARLIEKVVANIDDYSGKGPQKVLGKYTSEEVVSSLCQSIGLNN